MRPPLRLVPDGLSHDTIEAIDQIHQLAHRGRVVGIAVIVVERGRKYWVNSAGECRRSPTWTRGALADLHDELGALVRLGGG